MRTIFTSLITIASSLTAFSQFYPDINAVWCGTVLIESVTGFSIQFQMSDTPDTLMNGTVYKRISAFGNPSSGFQFIGDYYVRSDVDGKGYLYRPSIGDELLTGDINAQAGDTVQDVLVAVWEEPFFTFQLFDLVVDSVVVLSNEGVTVTRHYFDPTTLLPFNPFNPIDARKVFWQAGMGTAFGPFVVGSSSFYQCVVNDTMQYDLSNNGLPGPGGVGQSCWQLNLATPESGIQGNGGMRISPNPAENDLVIELIGSDAHLGGQITFFDPLGRVVLVSNIDGPIKQLDVAALKGFYSIVLESGAGHFIARVVIQ
jgi:hypothetical protein